MSGRAVRAVQGSEGEGVVKRVRRTNAPWGVEVEKCAHLPCDRPRRSSQLCEGHSRRMERGQEIATPMHSYERHPTQPRRCAVFRCTTEQFKDLLCVRHWRHLRLGELSGSPVQPRMKASA